MIDHRTFRRAVGLLALAVPSAMSLCFLVLRLRFDYPQVLNLPADQVLDRLGRSGTLVGGAWLGVTLSAVLLVALVVCLDRVLRQEKRSDPRLAARIPYLSAITTFGMLAAVCMILDLSQWVWLYPELGRRFVAVGPNGPMQASLEIVWSAFHRYLGVGIGLYAATLFSGLWALGAGWILLAPHPHRRLPPWLAVASGLLFLASIAPGVGFGAWALLNSIGFAIWTLWLLTSGLLLLLARPLSTATPAPPE